MLTITLALAVLAAAAPDGPADNVPDRVRPVPRPGVAAPEAERASLQSEITALAEKIAAIEAKADPKLTRFVPDVRIFHKAADWALRYNEFFDAKEFAKAHALLAEGTKRADALFGGEAPWTEKSGLVVLGYVSKIDGSTQPYGMVVPESWQPKGPFRHRLDIWFHGRGETLSELNFLDERMKKPGEFTPEDTFVLHPYGRFCNAFKFAGEVDVMEALDDAKSRYKVDEDRISVRGFSMGGAAAWHFAVHYPDRWFAANPGAGFSETPRFLNVFQREDVQSTDWEKILWNLYDCDVWVRNLLACPTVAYSGALDGQKQAADVMVDAAERVGLPLTHVIGPRAKHAYEAGAKEIVARTMDGLAARGRPMLVENSRFLTYTLRYNTSRWLTIDAIGRHWSPATLSVDIGPDEVGYSILVGDVQNVEAFSIHMPAGSWPFGSGGRVELLVDPEDEWGHFHNILGPRSDLSFDLSVHRDPKDRNWKLGPLPNDGLRKRHGLQGPIDDAFLEAFTFVRPTGTSKYERVAAWVKSESERAVRRWRTQMRGDARVRDDKDVTDADIASGNLVLWGDPASNSVLAKIADKLPIRWEGESIKVGDSTYSAADHVPILIFPNPLNLEKYVVLNSGFTYREYDDLNNARQVPKLPDWAIVDVRTPPSSRFPGKVVAADFFDESWKLKAK